MKNKGKSSLRGEQTRDALLDAAMLVFAREGFQSANLREIAEAGAVNPALIGYHFHSKEGLYLAVFERMIGQLRQVFEPLVAGIEKALATPGPGSTRDDLARRYLPLLLGYVEAMGVHMVHEHPAWGELIVREQHSPTAAYELLHERLISRSHGAVTRLLQALRQDPDQERASLLAATILAQVLIIRSTRTTLLRLMRWDSIGDRELEVMKVLIRRNTTLLALGD
jgi:AcrR family transcriptional regulator